MASFIDVPPTTNGWIYVNDFTFYDGDASAAHPFRLGGELVLDVAATVYADTSVILYQTPWTILGGRYGVGAAIPYQWVEVEGAVQGTTVSVRREDQAQGFGDIEAFPLLLEWKCADVSFGTSLGVYLPTGAYDQEDLANVGRNYWTFEPGVNISWLSSTIGTEATLFSGFDMSTENPDTDYRSGHVFHMDGTLAQHLPLCGGIAGAGVTGFYYEQVTGDTGGRLGDFEGRAMGVGPVISYVMNVGSVTVVAEVKWLREMNVEHRLEGDILWAKVAALF
jgi:hypothetical protein